MKKILFAVTLSFFSLAFAGDFTEYENKLLSEVYEKRVEARKCASYLEMQTFLEKYHAYIRSDEVQSRISDEARLTYDNLLILERWQCLWEIDSSMPGIKEMITSQFELNLSWSEDHPYEEQNPWLKLSSFDLINSTMQYLKQSELIKLGLLEKKVYDDLVEKFPDMSMALLLAGHWYYNAPAIGGGSKIRARKYYARAAATASNIFEKYFANIYLAQNELEKKNMKEYKDCMAAAENAVPATFYLEFIRKINAAGYTLYEYALKPDMVKEKVFGDKEN